HSKGKAISAEANGSGGIGIHAYGKGVAGYFVNDQISGKAISAEATGTGGIGIYAYGKSYGIDAHGENTGVRGYDTNGSGYGWLGYMDQGVRGLGDLYGVYGEDTSANGSGYGIFSNGKVRSLLTIEAASDVKVDSSTRGYIIKDRSTPANLYRIYVNNGVVTCESIP
ncbi:MAG: hypothetical protein KKA31_00235, partial [Candidatus Margulisbacteria bacterium]|nr:hypothetical protein [Candidatus Margulisiibacteriota bacterium]